MGKQDGVGQHDEIGVQLRFVLVHVETGATDPAFASTSTRHFQEM